MAEKHLVFFGSDAIGLPLLDWLHTQAGDRVHLRAVVTQPDRAHGRGKKVIPGPIKTWALEKGVEVLQPAKPGTELTDWMRAEAVDVAIVLAYGHLLRRQHLDCPPLGFWNFHGSLLPALRGASPIETALAEGFQETGMTFMKMVFKMDAGPVVGRECLTPRPGETADQLRARMGKACVPLMAQHLDGLLAGTLDTQEQDEAAVTFCRKLEKSDGWLDFHLSAERLECRARACHPWPGSYFESGGTRIRAWDLEVAGGDVGPEPGFLKINEARDAVCIQTGTGTLVCRSLQRPGGKMMPAADFLRGFPLKTGTILQFTSSKPWVQSTPFSYKKKPS